MYCQGCWGGWSEEGAAADLEGRAESQVMRGMTWKVGQWGGSEDDDFPRGLKGRGQGGCRPQGKDRARGLTPMSKKYCGLPDETITI